MRSAIIKKVAPGSMLARIFLAFLATAGLFYVNIMPAIVDGLISALGFTNQQAGSVASANIYGAALGALLIVFLVRFINWRIASAAFLIALISVDLASMLVNSPAGLVIIRFCHGFIGGMLVGTAFSVIARTVQPDRTFGVLLFVQFGLGGLGVMFIPGLVPEFGTPVLFFSLIAFSAASLAMLPFLPGYKVDVVAGVLPVKEPVMWGPLLLTLVALFLFQAANMALYAFIIGLGEFYGQERGFITNTLGISAWLGLAGAGLVIVIANRFGYVRSLLLGIGITTIANAGLLLSDIASVFFLVNAVIGITWAYCMSYLLGLVSRFDKAGQMAALGGFASKMGLASGPAIGALLLGENNYPLVISVAVIALVICLAAVFIPAWRIDHQ